MNTNYIDLWVIFQCCLKPPLVNISFAVFCSWWLYRPILYRWEWRRWELPAGGWESWAPVWSRRKYWYDCLYILHRRRPRQLSRECLQYFWWVLECFNISISTHDNEQLGQGHHLSFEQFVDRSLGQASHLPPVREKGEACPEEADDVDQDDEDDDQVVI